MAASPPQIDELIRTRRKTVALIVEPDGRLVVRAPLRTPKAQIIAFVQEKADWVRAKQQRAITLLAQASPKQFTPDETFLYLGQAYPLNIVTAARPALAFQDGFTLAQAALPRAARVFQDWYREQARVILAERVAHFARRHGFAYTQVKITSARTRWGSCSSRGVLSFPWRLAMAPLAAIDYVVVHELVHLRVKNHSKDFWAQVAAILPDYPTRRTWLKKNGAGLKL